MSAERARATVGRDREGEREMIEEEQNGARGKSVRRSSLSPLGKKVNEHVGGEVQKIHNSRIPDSFARSTSEPVCQFDERSRPISSSVAG